MSKLFILVLSITGLLASCSPGTVSPLPLLTVTTLPTITPSPAPSATPTITPYPSLQTQGPYLLFTRDNKNLTLMDADGGGRRQIRLPDEGYINDELNHSVSGDGRWLAFFTGSTKEPYDLALNIFNLKAETVLPITNLLAPAYPENLMLTTLNQDFCPAEIPDCQAGAIRTDFETAITRTIAWSPDSKTLAFAAQIDGPSSDVYLYSVEKGSIRRLVDDLENVWSIRWSPDGNKVLYENFQSGIYTFTELYIADPEVSAVQSPKSFPTPAFWEIGGWIDNNLLFVYDSGDGGAPHNLRYLNIETGQTNLFWTYETEIFGLYPELHGVMLALPPEVVEYYQIQMEPGTYFFSMEGNPTQLSQEIYLPVYHQNIFTDSLLARKDNDLYLIRISESTIQLIKEGVDFQHSPRRSPDKKWLMVEGADGLQLYSETLELINSWEFRNTEMTWRPDSAGLILFIDTAMYYLPIPDGEPLLIEDCAPDSCNVRGYVWLP
jgi:hypothetical protein